MTAARGQPTELDRRFMAAAISLGWRNAGLARPHPSVGAILVRKGPETGEGDEPTHGGPGQQRTPARPLSAADDDHADDHASLSKGN